MNVINYETRSRERVLQGGDNHILQPYQITRNYLGYNSFQDCAAFYPYTTSAGYKAYRSCRRTRKNLLLPYRLVSRVSIPNYRYEFIQDYIGKKTQYTFRGVRSYWHYPSRMCYRRKAEKPKCRVRKLKNVVEQRTVRYRPLCESKGKHLCTDMKPVKSFKYEQYAVGSDVLRNVTLRGIDVNPIPLEPGTGAAETYYNDTLSACNPLGVNLKHLNILPLPEDAPNVLDMYKNIAKNIGNIANFTMETEANMLVNLIEIKSIAQIFATRLLATMGPLGAIASLFLLKEFAIEPLIGDIATMIQINDKLTRAIDDWNSKAGEVQYFHYQLPKYSKEWTAQKSKYRDSYHYDVESRATIAIVGSRITMPKSAILLSQMGFNKPLSAFWELIPFSFVVDWFTDISGWISAFETPASPAHFRVVDACWSQKTKIIAQRGKASDDLFLFYRKGVQFQKQYQRKNLDLTYLNSSNFVQSASGWTPSSRFGEKQALISMALAVVLYPAKGRR